jgi:hypothetical protein
MTTAITHWIVELGELDSSFKKEIARLKAFLTGGCRQAQAPVRSRGFRVSPPHGLWRFGQRQQLSRGSHRQLALVDHRL